MKNRFTQLESLFISVIGLIITLTFFYLTIKIIPIKIFDPTSYVSVTASAILILGIAIIVLYIFLFFKSKNVNSLTDQIKIFLNSHVYIYFIAAGISSGIFWLAQSGTPLPPGALIGDVGNYLQDAIKYQETENLVYDYPPGLIFLLASFGSVLDLSVVEVSKLVYLLFGLVTPIILVIIYRKILPNYLVGSFLLLSQAGIFYIWKYSALVISVGIILMLIKDLLKSQSDVDAEPSKNFVKFVFTGSLFGLAQLVYFGYVWWLIPGIIFLTLLITLILDHRFRLLNLFDFYLGFALIFSGYIAARLGLDLIILLTIVVFGILLRIIGIFIKSNIIEFITKVLGGSTIFAWLYLLITTNINDSYVYEEALSNPGIIVFSGGLLGVFFIVALAALSIYVLKHSELNSWVFSIIVLAISPFFMGMLAASRFQITGLVELWPRYREVSEFIFFNLFLILVLLALDKFLESAQHNTYHNFNYGVLAIIVSLPIIIFSLGNISNEFYKQLPKEGRFSGYSYDACLDQVESKKTSGFFIDRPTLGREVMTACHKLLGKDYIIAPSYQWGFHPIEIFSQDNFWSWSYLETSSIYFVNQSPKSKVVALEFGLKKAPCLDNLVVSLVYKNEVMERFVLNGEEEIAINLDLESKLFEPQYLNLETNAKPCTVPGDEREILLQVLNLQDSDHYLSRLEYFDQ